MTPKQQLLQAIETTPDSILVVVLDFLNFLKSRQRSVVETLPSDDGVLPPQDLDFEDLAGIIKNPHTHTVAIEAMDQAIAKG